LSGQIICYQYTLTDSLEKEIKGKYIIYKEKYKKNVQWHFAA
jgi:hypothetical protein